MKKEIPEHITNDVFNETKSSVCVWKRQNYELHCRRFGGLLISYCRSGGLIHLGLKSIIIRPESQKISVILILTSSEILKFNFMCFLV
jgi:hypothetical protein